MKSVWNIIIVVGVLAAIWAAMHFQKGGGGGKADLSNVAVTIGKDGTIFETPRTATPVASFTRFFAKKQFTIEEEGKKRVLTYHWFEPGGKPYPAGLKFPLVLVLHGAPGNAYAASYLITRQMQLNYPAFILIPMSPGGKIWAVPDKMHGKTVDDKYKLYQSLPDAVAMVRSLAQEHPVDTSRIYVIGCSDGGGGSYGAALRYPDIFAAAVPISGVWDSNEGAKATKVPMLILHGAHDAGIPAAGARAFAELSKQNGGSTHYTEFLDMGHECSNPQLYTQAMWQWMFAQKKKK